MTAYLEGALPAASATVQVSRVLWQRSARPQRRQGAAWFRRLTEHRKGVPPAAKTVARRLIEILISLWPTEGRDREFRASRRP